MSARRPIPLLRISLTLLGAFAAAQLCLWLRTPLPWMLGPLIATSLASILGAPTASSGRLRNGGQWIIGASLGLYFTPAVVQLIAGLWWAIAVAIVWALLLGCTACMHRACRRYRLARCAPPPTSRAPLARRPR